MSVDMLREKVAVATGSDKRIDALYFLNVSNCNPNGDPDNGNRPRQDEETGHGLISNVSVKRHVRDTIAFLHPEEKGLGIYYSAKTILDHKLMEGYQELGLAIKKPKKGAKDEEEAEEVSAKDSDAVAMKVASHMASKNWDIRAFGAVLASKVANGGQVRGPLQLGYARTIDPVVIVEDGISRGSFQTDREAESSHHIGTFGSKWRVLYGLYGGEITYTPAFAKKTGFGDKDLEVFWEAMTHLYEYTRSSSRDGIGMEQVIVFEHDNALGRAATHKLFRMVNGLDKEGRPLIRRKDETKPARSFTDYIFPTKQEVESRMKEAGIHGVNVHYML